MKKILTLAHYTFLELIREKMVLINLMLAGFLFLFSLVLGSLTLDEKIRVVTHFSLTAVHLSLNVMAIILGSSILQREIQRQTCLVILARPVSRLQFLLGKFFGIVLLLTAGWLILTCCIHILLWSDLPFSELTISLLGVYFEAIVLLAFAVSASTFLRPAISFLFCTGIYFLGHWLSDLHFFAKKSESKMFIWVADLFNWICPHLENFNWRSVNLIQSGIDLKVFASAGLHAFAWIAFTFVIGFTIFRRKDLV